ncbi:MAG: DNA-binding response regulator [Rubrivivax sp.]|jgi:DNA-binding response OmpR family regulator/DNA-binding CsgD family transcriptional regulator|nr:DNA-binding response regulator [Rubrivivax sp.]
MTNDAQPDPLAPHEPALAAAADIVLVVDDVPDNLALLVDALEEAGYTVLVATSGDAALALLARTGVDLVLLDAVMPGLDGFETARRIRADPTHGGVPIVFMTGLTESEHVVAAFAAGGTDYVTKPIRPREVLARIGAHLHTARAQRQARHALDAFGHATLVVRERDGRRLWQTGLARRMLAEHFGGEEQSTPPEVIAWVAREALRRRAGAEPSTLTVARGSRRITFALHALPEDSLDDGGQGEWLVVMRESDDAAVVEALALALDLTAREAEVLYWVAKGKTNRDIGDILGTSPRTVTKHLEHVFGKLGVETRTAAAGLAMGRVKELARAG